MRVLVLFIYLLIYFTKNTICPPRITFLKSLYLSIAALAACEQVFNDHSYIITAVFNDHSYNCNYSLTSNSYCSFCCVYLYAYVYRLNFFFQFLFFFLYYFVILPLDQCLEPLLSTDFKRKKCSKLMGREVMGKNTSI